MATMDNDSMDKSEQAVLKVLLRQEIWRYGRIWEIRGCCYCKKYIE